jgi:IS5 family transposase
MEDAAYNNQAILHFIATALSVDATSDAATLLKFLRLREPHKLTQVAFGAINGHLAEKGLLP